MSLLSEQCRSALALNCDAPPASPADGLLSTERWNASVLQESLFEGTFKFQKSKDSKLFEMDQTQQGRAFAYPWKGLEAYLRTWTGGPLFLLGMGSLLNAASSKLSFSSERGPRPVVGLGAKRVFDYPMAATAFLRYGPPRRNKQRAALNAYPTDQADAKLNGRLHAVAPTALGKLRRREKHYRLLPIETRDWYSGKPIEGPVFVLSYENGRHDLLPHPVYLRRCLRSARAVSPRFLAFFLDTTYLADGVTKLSDHIAYDPSLA